MKKKLIMLMILGVIAISTTGCKQDNMEDIDIAVTNYPNEFIVEKLYGNHADIHQIYPDGVELSNYKVTKKQKEKFSTMGLFIYTGLVENERNLAIDFLELNSDLRIIDTSYVLETTYSNEELWLNPSSLLMMAQNVRLGLKEYITSSYLTEQVDQAYDKLKIELSELDADYRLTVENTDNKVVVVSDSALKYLENFGLRVICLDSDITDKEVLEVEKMIKAGAINYIYSFKEQELTEQAKAMITKYPNIQRLELNRLDMITDKNRDDGEDYISLMNKNLDTLKQELYQ